MNRPVRELRTYYNNLYDMKTVKAFLFLMHVKALEQRCLRMTCNINHKEPITQKLLNQQLKSLQYGKYYNKN